MKLLAIDGNGVVRRIYGGLPGQDTPEKAAGAIETTTHSLKRALREHSPTHCLIAFDAGGPTWRHSLYPPYKAHRTPMPEALATALSAWKLRMIEAGWALMEHAGNEADDTLNSVAYCASSQFVDTVVLASDKDIASAGQYGARVYDHFAHEWHDNAWSGKKFGVGLHRLQDWLALVGDKTDGVPGVDSVGDKTATKLLLQHGSLEGVLAAAASIKGVIGANLRELADMARLSRQLTAMRIDLFPEGLDWDRLIRPSTLPA